MANRRDDVVLEFEADGMLIEGREYIDDSSAHAEVPRLLTLRYPLIAHGRKRIDEQFEVEALGGGDRDDRGVEFLARNGAHHQGFGGCNNYRRSETSHRIERRELRGLHVGRRRDGRKWLQ